MVWVVLEGLDLSVIVNGLKLLNLFVIGLGLLGINYIVMKCVFDEGWGGVIVKIVCICYFYFMFRIIVCWW